MKKLLLLAALGMLALPQQAVADSPKSATYKHAAAKHQSHRYVKDRVEDRYDRREDRRDRREDVRDRKEDIRDARHDGGKWDKREDRWDKREDRRDRWEDKWDKRENRGHRYGHYKPYYRYNHRKYYRSPVKHYWK